MKKTIVISTIALQLLFFPQPALCQASQEQLARIQSAQTMERSGNWLAAGTAYNEVMRQEAMGTSGYFMPDDMQRAVGKKAVECLNKALSSNPGDSARIQGMLKQLYLDMNRVDASNPRWPLMVAKTQIAEHKFVAARGNLEAAVRFSENDPAAAAEAQQLLNQINGSANNEWQRTVQNQPTFMPVGGGNRRSGIGAPNHPYYIDTWRRNDLIQRGVISPSTPGTGGK